ncbi:MAG TPA: shikimate dehydrogenase [Chloroflexota bacterium]|nr:shikimate dehydrogenase [Chloroflexota bacterium]
MDRYAVIGDPIDHSLSPAMQRAAFERAGIDACYEAINVPAGDLESALPRLRDLRGFNVTVPLKELLVRRLDEVDPAAQVIGAVNTVVLRRGRLHGYNTDPAGFSATLQRLGRRDGWSRVVVFGAGGAARAVLYSLAGLADRVVVVNRSLDRAEGVMALLNGKGVVMLPADSRLPAEIADAGLLVNATPQGMKHLSDLSPLPTSIALRPETDVIDLVYGRMTPLLRAARTAGCRFLDGLEMLVHQGAASFRLWTGVEPDIDAMRSACLAALGIAEPC